MPGELGPGAYDPLPVNKSSKPKFSLRGRYGDGIKPSTVPGPGHYDQSLKKQGKYICNILNRIQKFYSKVHNLVFLQSSH
jgi:hypothetical protein